MITQDQIPTVIHQQVYDNHGQKIGEVRHVYVDDATGRPEWLGVRTGMFGSRETFIPVRSADVVSDHVEIGYDKNQIKDAPNVDVDAGGHLSVDEERKLYRYYNIDWDEAGQAAHEPGEGQAGRTEERQEARFRGGAGPQADIEETRGREDDAMTRSEERLRVSKERYETGRARLRKYIVTEEQQISVPVSREEVRVEREPITDANRDEAMRGPEMTESEHEVTLHAERAHVEKETVPVERVRMTKEEIPEEETITEEVRREQIDVERDKRRDT